MADSTTPHGLDALLPCGLAPVPPSAYDEAAALLEGVGTGEGGWKGLLRACKVVDQSLELKATLSAARRQTLVHHLLRIVHHPRTPTFERMRACACAADLLERAWQHGRVDGVEWRPLLHLLLLHHCPKGRAVPASSESLLRQHRRALLSLVHAARAHYPEGTGLEVWAHCEPGLQQTATHSAFKALGILFLFWPTQQPPGVYEGVLPAWLESWASVDLNPEWDAMWLSLLCRARKYSPGFAWASTAAPPLLACAKTTLGVSVGSGSVPAERRAPPSFTVLFLDGVDAPGTRLVKLARLVAFLLCRGSGSLPAAATLRAVVGAGRVFMHPSNHAPCTLKIATLAAHLANEMTRALGWQEAAHAAAHAPELAGGRWVPLVTPAAAAAVVDAFAPLMLQGAYSRSPQVASTAAQALKALARLCPLRVGTPALAFCMGALEGGEEHAHQTPAALNLLAALASPLVRPAPLLCAHLPRLLALSLQGLDANDQRKTMETLALYGTLLAYLPIGEGDSDGSAEDPAAALAGWAAAAPLEDWGGVRADDAEAMVEGARGAGAAMAEWAAACLDRLLQVLTLQEAPAGDDGGAFDAARYLTKQQSGMLRVVARQLFGQMDSQCLAAATQRLVAFCEDGPLPNAAKDASFLVEGLAYANPAAVLPTLLPALLEGLVIGGSESAQKRTAEGSAKPAAEASARWGLGALASRALAWRLRLLRGAVRYGGRALLPFAGRLQATLRCTLGHEDAGVAGGAAKLLKALLAGLAETYPRDYRSAPPVSWPRAHGALPPLSDDGRSWASVAVAWHECSAEEATLAAALLEEHLLAPLETLGGSTADGAPADGRAAHARALAWQGAARSALACLRGGASLLHDHGPEDDRDDGAQGLHTGSAAVRFGLLVGLRQRAAAAATHAHARLWGLGEEGKEGLGPHRAVLTAEWIKVAGALLGRRGGAMAHQASQRRFISRHLGRQLSSPAATSFARGSYERALGAGAAPSDAAPLLSAARRRVPRRVLVERAFAHFLTRHAQAQHRLPYALRHAPDASLSLVYQRLLGALLACAAAPYATTRAAAQTTLEAQGWRCYTWLLKQELPALVARVADPSSSYDAAASALTLLHSTRALNKVCADAELWPALVLRLCRAGVDRNDALSAEEASKLVGQANTLLLRYTTCWVAKPEHAAAAANLQAALLRLVAPAGAGDARLHWRHELAATWCLVSLQQPGSSGLPAAFEWFGRKCLAAGDGAPLQKLGLAGLAAMASRALDQRAHAESQGVNAEAPPWLPRLGEASFCSELVRALAFDRRKTEEGGREQWSEGVEDLIREAQRGGAARFPKTRLAMVSFCFKSKHARLVKSLRLLAGPALDAPLLHAAAAALRGQEPTDARVYGCAAAEVVAGLVRADTKRSAGTTSSAGGPIDDVVWARALPVLMDGLGVSSYEWSSDWADAVRFMSGKRHPAATQPLADALLAKVKACFNAGDGTTNGDSNGGGNSGSNGVGSNALVSAGGDDYSTQAKYLRVLQGLLVETAAAEGSADALCVELVPLLLSNFAHPYKLCREMVGRTLFLVFDWALAPPTASSPHAALRAAALARARQVLLCGGETGAATEGESGVARRGRETAVTWLVTAALAGDGARRWHSAWPALLPPLFEGLADADQEHAALTKGVLRFLAQAASPTRALGGTEAEAAAALAALTEHPSWKVREEAVRFAAVLAARRLPLGAGGGAGGGPGSVRACVFQLLGDDRREVAEAAREAASLDFLLAPDAAALAETFEDLAHAALKKRRKANAKAASDARALRLNAPAAGAAAAPAAAPTAALASLRSKSDAAYQRGAMGLAALVLAHPYAVEPHAVAAIGLLAQLQGAGGMHGGTHGGKAHGVVVEVVKATFLEFKRTHLDEWRVHRDAFDAETLDAYNDCFDAPSYFA